MAVDWERLLSTTFFENTVQEYLIALGIFLGSMVVLRFFKFIIVHRLRKLSEKTENEIDDMVIEMIDVHWPFYVLISLYVGAMFITLPDIVARYIDYVLLFVLVYYAIKAVQRMIDFGAKVIIKKQEAEGPTDSSIIDLLRRIAKLVVWIVAGIFILSNLGVNIASLLAGVGIGGVAIAFALQNILADIFASFSIYFDKPFKIGDFIIIGTDMGVVEKIGIKSTRIKTLQGQELIVSNRELTETRVNNYGMMEKRRIQFTFGVVYQTTSKKMKKIPEIVKGIIEKIELAELDRAHFKSFGDSALIFEVVYYVLSSEYAKYMDIQQEINLKIKDAFEKEKIDMAYPTQTLYVNQIK